MSHIRPIKTETDYDNALTRIATLMDITDDARAGDELDVLATLVTVYEDANHSIDTPDPIDAIKFRMEQGGLSQTDLTSFIGSRSKVSEVLSGKRPLTLKMIRALNTHLGIPADVLIGIPNAVLPDDLEDVEWTRFPLNAMANFNWIEAATDLKDRAEETIRELMNRAGGSDAVPNALYRKNNSVRRNARMDPYALQAWCLYVLAEAREQKLKGSFAAKSVTIEFLREVACLSVFEEGPKLAREFLSEHGIALVYARHLPKTYLDGAAMLTKEGTPVVGVTVRYDRIDNFWFCLLHELAHVGWHLTPEISYFVDDLSLHKNDHEEDWAQEDEADDIAQNALIPPALLDDLDIASAATPMKVISLAHEAHVHPAIVAGRVRKDSGNYRLLSQFVGNGEVRKHFEESY